MRGWGQVCVTHGFVGAPWGEGWLVVGPFRGGGVLREWGLVVGSAAQAVWQVSAALSAVGEESSACMAAGRCLVSRSNLRMTTSGVAAIGVRLDAYVQWELRFPAAVRIPEGATYVIMASWVTGAVNRYVTGWARVDSDEESVGGAVEVSADGLATV